MSDLKKILIEYESKGHPTPRNSSNANISSTPANPGKSDASCKELESLRLPGKGSETIVSEKLLKGLSTTNINVTAAKAGNCYPSFEERLSKIRLDANHEFMASELCKTFSIMTSIDKKGAADILLKMGQVAMNGRDNKTLVLYVLSNLKLIMMVICNESGGKLLDLFTRMCAKLLDDALATSTSVKEFALTHQTELFLEKTFTMMIEGADFWNARKSASSNLFLDLRILLLSEVVLSKNRHGSLFKSLHGSRWFIRATQYGSEEEPMLILQLVVGLLKFIVPVDKRELSLALTKLVVGRAAARPMQWSFKGLLFAATVEERRISARNCLSSDLLEFLCKREAAYIFCDGKFNVIADNAVKYTCDNIISGNNLSETSLVAGELLVKMEERLQSDNWSQVYRSTISIAMLKDIISSVFDVRNDYKKSMWPAIMQLNEFFKAKYAPEFFSAFQVRAHIFSYMFVDIF